MRLLAGDAALNRIDDIIILQADTADLAEKYENCAYRIIMNLPHTRRNFQGVAMRISKDGGVVHYCAIAPEDDRYVLNTAFVEEAARAAGFKVEILRCGIGRSYVPHR